MKAYQKKVENEINKCRINEIHKQNRIKLNTYGMFFLILWQFVHKH